MGIVVFWLEPPASEFFGASATPKCKEFADSEMILAHAFMCEKRAQPRVSYVGVVSEPEGMVGTKDRGGAVTSGKLPNGDDYTWVKRRHV